MIRRVIFVSALTAAWLLACTGDDTMVTPDGGTPDGGTIPIEAGPVDASLPDTSRPDVTQPDPNDGFTAAEWATLKTLSPQGAKPPADPTNKYADNAAAARLGQMLYHETSYSGPLTIGSNGTNGGLGAVGEAGKVACVSCHSGSGSEDSRSKPNNVSLGTAYGTRNALSVFESSYQTWTNWGGRFDSQWSLPLAVAENASIMKSTRLEVVHMIRTKYKAEYEAAFPALDAGLSDTARFPLVGKPKANAADPDGPWEGMTAADKTVVNTVYSHFGKAIAAYIRLLVTKDAPFDRYVAGDRSALDEAQKRGLRTFLGKGCVTCHSGPGFTDGKFHAIGVGQTGPNVPATDNGRFQDVPALLASAFNTNGAYSDDVNTGKLTGLVQEASQTGQFRTPTLRGVARSAPYMHSGQLATLADVMAYYDKGGNDTGDAGIVKDPLMKPLGLQGTAAADLARFLEGLSGGPIAPALLQDTHKP